MSSFDRRGKYSYTHRDSQKNNYPGSRNDNHERDRRDSRRSRSQERFERPIASLLAEPISNDAARRQFDSFGSTPSFGNNTYGYEPPGRPEYDTFRDGNRFEEPRSGFNTFSESERYRTSRDEQFDGFRGRERYSPGSVFNRLDGGDNRFEPPQNFDEYRNREYPPQDGPNWDSSDRYEYSKHQMSLNEPSYINSGKERDVSSEIPEFDPEVSKISARNWLQILDDVGTKENWSGDVKKFWFGNKMTGSAKNFLNFGNVMQDNWYTIKKSFIKTYPSDMDFHHLLTDMMAVLQGETENLLNYFNAKLAAIKTCDISGKKAVSLLIGGLHNRSLRNSAFKHNFNTPEELFAFFNQTLRDEPNPPIEKPEIPRGACLICGGDHAASDCITRKNCSRKEKNLLLQQDLISKTVTWPKYIIDVKVNGRYLRGYADLDSDEVTITEEAAKSINLSWKKSYGRSIRAFGANMIRPKGETEVVLRVHKAMASSAVYIVSDKDQSFPIVIGKSYGTLPSIRFSVTEHQIQFYERDSKPAAAKLEPERAASPGPAPKKFRRDDKFDSKNSRYDSNKKKHGPLACSTPHPGKLKKPAMSRCKVLRCLSEKAHAFAYKSYISVNSHDESFSPEELEQRAEEAATLTQDIIRKWFTIGVTISPNQQKFIDKHANRIANEAIKRRYKQTRTSNFRNQIKTEKVEPTSSEKPA